jgi:hypothetical protein
LTAIIFFGICLFADGHTDPFYLRFTTPKQNSLILGTSRSAQGLQPKILKDALKKDFFNYSFTISHSPFGKVYYESIIRKHKKEKGAISIIAVDPWSISSWCSPPNDLSQFRENNLILNENKIVNLNPNIFYLIKSFNDKYINLINSENDNLYLHKDGWLEVDNIKMDSTSVEQRIYNKSVAYRSNHLPITNFSSVRLEYLIKIIVYLKQYGNVYLIRLPIHKNIMEIEEELMSDFDHKIEEAVNLSDGYLDLTPQNELFDYTDGNHLYKNSGKNVSLIVANWIKKNYNLNTN